MSQFEFDTVKRLLDFAYLGQITISASNVLDAIKGADFLQMVS